MSSSFYYYRQFHVECFSWKRRNELWTLWALYTRFRFHMGVFILTRRGRGLAERLEENAHFLSTATTRMSLVDFFLLLKNTNHNKLIHSRIERRSRVQAKVKANHTTTKFSSFFPYFPVYSDTLLPRRTRWRWWWHVGCWYNLTIGNQSSTSLIPIGF